AIRSRDFKLWLAGLHYGAGYGAANGQTIGDAITVLEAQVRSGSVQSVFTRIADVNGVIHLDLADTEWRTVEIDSHGWRVRRDSPVRFRRPRGMWALPMPERGGHVDALREFINVD